MSLRSTLVHYSYGHAHTAFVMSPHRMLSLVFFPPHSLGAVMDSRLLDVNGEKYQTKSTPNEYARALGFDTDFDKGHM